MLSIKTKIYFRWNEALIKNVLPATYINIVQSLIRNESKPEDLYRALPSIQSTFENWKSILESLFKPMLHDASVFWTECGGGSWQKLSQTFFFPEDLSPWLTDRVEVRAVKRFLVDIGVTIVAELPSHFTQALIEFGDKKKIQVKSNIPLF